MGRLRDIALLARPALRRRGHDIVQWPRPHHPFLRSRILQQLNVDLVLDVGANRGQFAKAVREWGYHGQIISFEPMRDAFGQLRLAAESDPAWRAVRSAVGAESSELKLNISQNSVSSSLLPMLDRHLRSAPRSAYVASELVPVEPLDALVDVPLDQYRPFLKIDTQGYERQVLMGASDVLAHAVAVELELSLVSLYEGQALLPESIDMLAERGFRLAEIVPGFFDADSGETLQADGIFLRNEPQS